MSKSINPNPTTKLQKIKALEDEINIYDFSAQHLAQSFLDYIKNMAQPGSEKRNNQSIIIKKENKETFEVESIKVNLSELKEKMSLDKVYTIHYFIMEHLLESKDYKSLVVYQTKFIEEFFDRSVQKIISGKGGIFIHGTSIKVLNLNFINNYCQFINPPPIPNSPPSSFTNEASNPSFEGIFSKRQEQVVQWNLLGDYWETLLILLHNNHFSIFQALLNHDELFYKEANAIGINKLNSNSSPLKNLLNIAENKLDKIEPAGEKEAITALNEENVLFDLYEKILDFTYVGNPRSMERLMLLSGFLQHYSNSEKASQRIESLLKNFNYLEKNNSTIIENINYLVSTFHRDFPGQHAQNIHTASLLMLKEKYDFDFSTRDSFEKIHTLPLEFQKEIKAIFINLANKLIDLFGLTGREIHRSLENSKFCQDIEEKIAQCLLVSMEISQRLGLTNISSNPSMAHQTDTKKLNNKDTSSQEFLSSIPPKELEFISSLGLVSFNLKMNQEDKDKITRAIQLEPKITARYEKLKLDLALDSVSPLSTKASITQKI